VKKSSINDPGLFLESIPIPATRTYVELVLRDAEVYRQLLGGSPHFAQCPRAQFTAPPGTAEDARGNSTPAWRNALPLH
jgi:hypothetical protein